MFDININPIACFNAHKNSVDQTGVVSNTPTAISFGTELYDIGGLYNTSTSIWTPPAGRVIVIARFKATGTITAGGATNNITIIKNGAALSNGLGTANFTSMTNQVSGYVALEDICFGSDTYAVNGTVVTSSGTATFIGTLSETNFCGHWVGPI